MSYPLIVYFGKPGLDTQVFQSYMVSSGYKVQVACDRDCTSSALDANPDAIVVIAVDQEPQALIHHAEALRSHVSLNSHILVISPAEPSDLQLNGFEVIQQPYRLSELVKRIRALIPDIRPN